MYPKMCVFFKICTLAHKSTYNRVKMSVHSTGRGINLRNFLAGQGSRHISIRYFWLCERIKLGEVTLEHIPTNLMFANVLTKPLQGKQFVIIERDEITY